MATIEIRKKSVSVWTHTPSDFEKFIQSRFRCKVVGDYFRVVEFGGRQLSEYLFSDVTVYDDTQGGGAETFSSGEELMLRLESLEYPAFTQGSGGGGVGFQPVVVNPQNGETLIYSDGQWVNGFLDLNGNRFITVQEIPDIVNGEITLPEGFVWVINTNNYFNANDEVFEIEEATAGFYRTDIIVAQASETQPFIYIQGLESEDTAVPPIVPDNTLLVTSIPVFGDQIGTPTAPIDGSEFIKKISEQWASYVLTGIGGLPILPQINENNRNINITGNPTGLSSLGGFVASGGASIANFWDGMTAKVLNSSPNNQTIKHNYSGADIKYLFPNEEDYTIRPNEVVYFDLKGGNLVFRYSTFLNAKNVFFDNTGTDLDSEEVEGAIKELRGLDLNDFTNTTLNRYVRLDETLVKLEENMTFTVGAGKDFETITEAIDQALNYYPNADYKITILIDEGFEISENISYQGLDFSHIIIKTTGVITVNPALTGIVFNFQNCWLPRIDEFYINGNTSVSQLFYFSTSFASLIINSEISGFVTSIVYSGVFSARIENTIIEVPAVSSSYGINAQNSYVRTNNNTQIVSLNTTNLNISSYGVFANSGSVFGMSGTVLGNFRRALFAQGATIISSTQTLEATQHHLFVERGGTIINLNTGTLTSNIPLNTLSGNGLILNHNKPNPINFNGTDYILDYIKAPSGQEYNVTVDDTGKLISEPKPDLSNFVESDDLGSAAFADSSVEPTTGTIPLRYGIGEGRVKVGNGTSEKDAVNKSQLDAQAVGRVRVESWVISLDKSQINNLHTTPISVLWSDMGLTNTQVVRWRPELTAVKIDDNGTPFSGPSPIQIGKYPIQGVISVPVTTYGVNGVYAGFPVQLNSSVGVEPEFTIETAAEITGGGSSARIQIMLFYEIDTITFL